jgi:hypothetical protein
MGMQPFEATLDLRQSLWRSLAGLREEILQ